MDFMELYNNCKSAYEMGIGMEIKDYLSCSEDVNEYSMKLVEEELIIHIKCKNLYIHKFVYCFLAFISYEYLCMLHKAETNDYYIYYIYTQMNNNGIGMKIQLKFFK